MLQRGWGGGKSSLTPTKRGVKQVLTILKGAGVGTEGFWVVLTWELKVLAILKGDTKGAHPLKGGRKKFYPVLRGWGPQKVSDL